MVGRATLTGLPHGAQVVGDFLMVGRATLTGLPQGACVVGDILMVGRATFAWFDAIGPAGSHRVDVGRRIWLRCGW